MRKQKQANEVKVNASRIVCVIVGAIFSLYLPPLSSAPLIQGVTVSMPNGYANITVDDLSVQTRAGAIKWVRTWNGQEWRFNPQWESLSQSWKNLTGSQTADTTGSASAQAAQIYSASTNGRGSSNCWVWVDEDWSPTPTGGTVLVGGVFPMGPMLPERMAPFNRIMGDSSSEYVPPRRVSIDYANLCMGSYASDSAGSRDMEAIRRVNELYLGEAGRYAFSNRSILEKRDVRYLPSESSSSLDIKLSTGQLSVALVVNGKGYRLSDRTGSWIDYNTQGQMVSWGDKNNNAIWLARDVLGKVYGVVDSTGRVIYKIQYNQAGLIVEVRDFQWGPLDLPSRTLRYDYDAKNRLTSVKDARGYSTVYDYDAANQIVRIVDPEGRENFLEYNSGTVKRFTSAGGAVTDYVFEYDDVNKQFNSKITGPETSAGKSIQEFTHNRVGGLVRRVWNGVTYDEISYDTGSRSTISTNARGFASKLVKNEFDQPVELHRPDGTVLRRRYSAVTLQPVEDTAVTGVKTSYDYDDKGNLTKKVEAIGLPEQKITEFEVNSLGQTAKMIQKGRTEVGGVVTADAIWGFEYDDSGQLRKSVDPEGYVREYFYDRAGNLRKQTNANGVTTRFDFDAQGNLVSMVEPLNRTKNIEYDKVGNAVRYVGADGLTQESTYDSNNRVVNISPPAGGDYVLTYDKQGNLTSERDEDGVTHSLQYDNFQRKIGENDGLGNKTQYSYSFGLSSELGALEAPVEVTFPTYKKQVKFDALERPTLESVTYQSEQSQLTVFSANYYNLMGMVEKTVDPYGKEYKYSYDALGKLTRITDRLNHPVDVAYDARGNLIEFKTPQNHTYKFDFDRNNRLTRETLPLGQTQTYSYDGESNIKEIINWRGGKKKYFYDDANRLQEEKIYSIGDLLEISNAYSWSLRDKLTAWSTVVQTGQGTESFSADVIYDEFGRKVKETFHYPAAGGGSFNLSYGYKYSLAGRKTAVIWPDMTELIYGYSSHGKLKSVVLPNEGLLEIKSYKWNLPATIQLPGAGRQTIDYDGLQKMESFVGGGLNGVIALDIKNRYGKNQELTAATRSHLYNSIATTRSENYSYDDENRLLGVTSLPAGQNSAQSETFELNSVAGRVRHSKTEGIWAYDQNSRLLNSGAAATYQYDSAGNLIEKTYSSGRVLKFFYNANNQLENVKNSAGDIIARYAYDPMSRRILKDQFFDKDGQPLPQAYRTYYLYSDEGLIAEAKQPITKKPNGNVQADGVPVLVMQYGFQPDSPFGTEPLFVKSGVGDLATVGYYAYDHLRTPNQIVNKDGDVLWGGIYDAYGAVSIASTGSFSSNLRFAGQYADEESGFYYNWHRYYDPNVGRYIQADPLGVFGGMDVYAYVSADPLNKIDPFGLRPLNDREKKCLSPYIPQVDLDNADLHDGEVPWYLGKEYDGITRGNDIYFRPGVYDANSSAGIALLGHELVHVGHYRNGMTVAGYIYSTRNGYRQSPYEQEAYAKQDQILRDLRNAKSRGEDGDCPCVN